LPARVEVSRRRFQNRVLAERSMSGVNRVNGARGRRARHGHGPASRTSSASAVSASPACDSSRDSRRVNERFAPSDSFASGLMTFLSIHAGPVLSLLDRHGDDGREPLAWAVLGEAPDSQRGMPPKLEDHLRIVLSRNNSKVIGIPGAS